MKMKLVSLVLFFAFQNNVLMSMQQQQQAPSAPPAVAPNPIPVLMEAQIINPAYQEGFEAGIVQSGCVMGTVQPLQNQEGLVIAAAKKGFERQNIGQNSATTAYLFDKVKGLLSSIGELQEGIVYEYRNNKLQQIARKNKIESCREMVSGFANNNILLQTLAFIGCARSVGCLVWVLGNPALTPQYLAWYLTIGIGSSILNKISYGNVVDENHSLAYACSVGMVVGACSRQFMAS